MNRRHRLAAALLCLILSCTSDPDIDDGDHGGWDSGSADGPGGGMAGADGLPCDVAQLLRDRCQSCHRQPPVGGAPMALLSYEDLSRMSPIMPGQTVAQRALQRMGDAGRPMPPGQGVTVPAAELAAFRGWVEGGLRRSTCGSGDMGPDPFASPPLCTSMRYWRDDDFKAADREPLKDGSGEMNPGQACISCHRRSGDKDAPRLFAGGTVYPTAHEPDLCIGTSGATVEITDANGVVRTLTTNRSGNFLLRDDGTLRLPLRARVLYQGRERRMNSAQMSGDCNSCHTQQGYNGAPGRIVLP